MTTPGGLFHRTTPLLLVVSDEFSLAAAWSPLPPAAVSRALSGLDSVETVMSSLLLFRSVRNTDGDRGWCVAGCLVRCRHQPTHVMRTCAVPCTVDGAARRFVQHGRRHRVRCPLAEEDVSWVQRVITRVGWHR